MMPNCSVSARVSAKDMKSKITNEASRGLRCYSRGNPLQSLFKPPIISNPSNRLLSEDRGIHDWYRFVLSFPAHLVRDYLKHWGLRAGQKILDPFCGTGSTILEAKKLGFEAFGIDANAMAHFASHTKTNWSPDPSGLLQHAQLVTQAAKTLLETNDQSYRELSAETDRLSIVQIEQDIALCKNKFSDLICLSIGAQFISENKIALFGFQETPDGVRLTQERHYRLVQANQLSNDELREYQNRLE
jgi:hypothetical protein